MGCAGTGHGPAKGDAVAVAQFGFDFTVPAVDPREVSATGKLPPVSGTTPQARHSSYTGAVHALEARGEKVEALRQLLLHHGPLTLNDCADRLRWPLSSVCSLKAALGDQVVPDGSELVAWGEGKSTRRTRWKVNR